ncbi:MAG: fumarate hydratase [Desulfitobacterium hafniense]|nr:fumarate hydratase [Desulfitobacterium hafniense]
MRTIYVTEITKEVARLCQEACYDLPEDVLSAIKLAAETEKSPLGKSMLNKLVENARLATEERMPYCHDTAYDICGGDVYTEGISNYAQEE